MAKENFLPNSFGVVVKDLTDRDFIGERESDTSLYNSDPSRQRVKERRNIEFGQILNLVQYFAEIGGFDGVLSVLRLGMEDDKAAKVSFNMVSYLIKPFKCLNTMLTPEFSKSFTEQAMQVIVKRLGIMTEKDVKSCNKDTVDQVLKDLSNFLAISMSHQELSQVRETTELNIALRFLKGTNLEKRLKGLQDIREMIDRINKTQRALFNKQRN